MKFSKPSLLGAGLGLVMGVAFTIVALVQFDESETNAKDVALAGLVVGVPLSVLIGLSIGWAWGRLFGFDSLN